MTRLSADAQSRLSSEIAQAGGREVSFVAEVDEEGRVTAVRPVARGTVDAVLALPGVARRGEMLLHNHPSGVLDPSPADLTVAAKLFEAGIGFGIVSNDASAFYVVVEIPRAPSRTPIDAVAAAGLLGVDGPVSRGLGAFEDRPSQRDMTAYAADTYNEGGVSLLEAGTGVGKSFAYLVPAVAWARANGERTIVSTNTINLQEQLVGKDLPLLAGALDDDFGPVTYALLKGWRNYLCLSRLDTAHGSQASLLEAARQQELEQMSAWARKTADGSLADLPFEPTPEVWDEVSAEPDLCGRLKCPHFDACFVFAARRRAAEADVVVVNHHLLASDLAVRRAQENWQDAAVLPPYQRLILDEAHHLEDTAGQHLGANVTSWGVTRLLSRMERSGRGLIPALITELVQRDDALSAASADLLRQGMLPDVSAARERAERLFFLLAERLVTRRTSVMRLTDAFVSDPIWREGLDVAVDGFVAILKRLRDGIETVADRMELEGDLDRRSQLLNEMRGVVRRLESVSDGVLLTLRPTGLTPGPAAPLLRSGQALRSAQGDAYGRGERESTPDASVRWIERRGTKPVGGLPFGVGLCSVPLNLAPVLKETLFDRVETVVLTSATLSTAGDFGFLKGRLGIDLLPSRIKYEQSLPSPFNFMEQCLFGVPTDIPDSRSSEPGHDQALAQAIIELGSASDGGMFVLFTSHAQLKRTAAAVREAVGSRWPLLIQGEGQRDRLLRRFREAGSAILMGTDSFWEGVDVPGPSLRLLLLAKLPFKVPDEPLTAARLERIEALGGDGFRDYLLPNAALKLKQGFGRLIRSRTDVGAVVLMDHRIVTKTYGRVLLESLPPARQVIGSWAEVRTAVEDFFARHGLGAPV
ncbi:MAG: helicase [Gemmatimonadetes bacterium]|nr:helicase [Gemmatimonadota bacterium]